MTTVRNKNKSIFIAPELSFKKKHKGLIVPEIYNKRLITLGYFAFGIKALEPARITPKQNESLRRILVKKFKDIVVSTNHSLIPGYPISKKAMGIRMGKGKGAISYWVNRLSSSKISLYIRIPHIIDNLNFFKYNYQSICKRFNYNSKLIINNHFLQEKYNNMFSKINYWKFMI